MLIFQIIRALNRNFVTTAMLKKQRLMTKYWLKQNISISIFLGEKEIIRTPLLNLLEVSLLL